MKKTRTRTALLLALAMMLTMCLGSVPALATEDAPVEITLATWQDVVLLEEMCAKFNELNPGIVAKVADQGGWFDNTKLSELAAAGTMPDVFVITTPEVPVANGWMMDLTPYLEAETEKTWYDATVLDYDGKTYMLPYSIFFYGVIVNKTLLGELNIPIPGYDWTIDEFMDIAEKASTGNYYGMHDANAIYSHAPAQINPETGWSMINMNLREYNLDQAFIDSINMTKELIDKKYATDSVTFGLATDDEKNAKIQEELGVTALWEYWMAGNVALIPSFSWDLGLETNALYGGFEWDFYPFPVSEKGNDLRTGIVADAAGIRADTAHPDEAFKLLKFMTYDPAGYEARVEIAANYDKAAMMEKYPQYEEGRFPETLGMTDLPGAFTQEILATWSEINNAKPGVAYCISGIPNGYLDGYKCVPGWSTSQWDIIGPAITNEILPGQKAAGDIAAELKEKADAAVAEAYAAMGIE